MGKYFQVEVKPTISVTALASGNIANEEILFDWFGFDIPKGSARLIGMTIQYKGKNAVDYPPTDFEIFWAKSYRGNPPGTLGGEGGVVDTFTSSWFPNIVGHTYVDGSQNSNDDDLHIGNILSVGAVNQGHGSDDELNNNALVLTGEPDSGDNVGYDKLYIASVAKSTHNWGPSTMTIDTTLPSTSSPVITVADLDAIKALSPGDVLRDEDNQLIGTVKTIDSATQVTLEANSASVVAEDKLVYNTTPITFILSFER